MYELYNHYSEIKIKWRIIITIYIIYLFWFIAGIFVIVFGYAPALPILILEFVLIIALIDTVKRLPKQFILYNDKILLPVNNLFYLIKWVRLIKYKYIKNIDCNSGKCNIYTNNKIYSIYIKDIERQKRIMKLFNNNIKN